MMEWYELGIILLIALGIATFGLLVDIITDLPNGGNCKCH